jgi:DNA-binding protein H-NS
VATFKGTDAMLLYLERVRSLALEQEATLREAELKKKREEVEDLREEVEIQKRKVQTWQRTLQKARVSEPTKLEDIQSEVNSAKSASSDASMSLMQDDMKGEYLLEEEPKLDRSPLDGEELKRVFFSQCLAIKLGFKPKDPAQAVPIPALYRKALEAKISVENWPEFIHKELNQPEQWITKAKPSRRFAPRPINTKFTYFETIKEEEVEGQTDQ